MFRKLSPFAFSLVLGIAPLHAQSVLDVPGSYATIASALSAAGPGDTILVAPGTYKESLKWPSVDGIRLVSTAGPTLTTIDGQSAGRVLEMSGTYGAGTRIEGFTITGGKMTTSRNYGVGIHLNGRTNCTPVFRDLVVTGNVGDGTSWNYGGGMYVYGSGTRPRVEFCRFENNTLQNGSWNYGAGIYIGGGASIELVGCTVQGNLCKAGSRGYGGGVYLESGSAPDSLIASCVIESNVCQTGTWNYGGGLLVAGQGSALVVGNTFSGNQCVGGSYSKGGNFANYSSGIPVVACNLFVQGAAKNGGGVARTSTSNGDPKLLSNCFWSNQNGDYDQVTPGVGDIQKDPLFVPNTLRLLPASPCLEIGVWDKAWDGILQDRAGASRRVDFDRDGQARMDLGAYEYGWATLSFSAAPGIGKAVFNDVGGRSGDVFSLFLEFGGGGIFVEPFGEYLLGSSPILLSTGNVPGRSPFLVPNFVGLRGMRVHLQALTLGTGSQLVGELSNDVQAVIL